MGSNSTALVEVSTLSRPQTAMEIRAQVNLIQEVMQAVMKKDTHFGTIPGCDKPTLYKPGSEKILSTFRIAIEPIVEDLSTADVARYRVITRATSMATGAFLGSGVGEASSEEEKYKWREAVCAAEYDNIPDDRKRMKYRRKRDGGYYTIAQVRTEKADLANTVLKMAKKRSQIDVTLTVTAASDIFTQDIEDLPEELQQAVQDEGQPAKPAPVTGMPQRKAQQNAATPQATPAVQTPPAETKQAPAANPAPTQIKGLACPQCGEALESDGCHFCGWEPNSKPATAQQQRQEPQRHSEAPSQSARTDAGPVISDAQAKRFFGICMSNGITKPEMKAYLKQRFGIDDDRHIPKSGYEEACSWAQGND